MTEKSKFIIIGDIMLDIYIYGNVSRIANEAPIPVLTQDYETRTLGGCGNVLMNMLALGADTVYIFSAIGEDSYGQEIQQKVKSLQNVVSYISPFSNRKTITKFRGFTDKKMLFKYEIEDVYTLEKREEEAIKQHILYLVSSTVIDGIVFSDYNKGYITNDLAEFCIDIANKMNIPTFVDPKRNFEKFRNCTVFKPNTHEVKALFSMDVNLYNLETIHTHIKKSMNCSNSIITLSEKGISLVDTSGKHFYQSTIPTDVYDVTGAGDIVLAVLSYYYKKKSKQELLKLCTVIATRSVSHPGTYVITDIDLCEANKVLSTSKLISIETLAKMNCHKIITNGCFDILHEGHMSLFEYCSLLKKENSTVIVAINSDESIKRLKGLTRPINSLMKRIAMLNYIHFIDWIVVFHDNTPETIYSQIKPDILVKGGDYTAEELPGRQYCKEICICPYRSGCSTTNIIKQFELINS